MQNKLSFRSFFWKAFYEVENHAFFQTTSQRPLVLSICNKIDLRTFNASQGSRFSIAFVWLDRSSPFKFSVWTPRKKQRERLRLVRTLPCLLAMYTVIHYDFGVALFQVINNRFIIRISGIHALCTALDSICVATVMSFQPQNHRNAFAACIYIKAYL